ncbi:MAG: hypothetical protein HY304_07970 [candidate division Zixibacteria bacterium]|nr:hypothetical protein [candidate division Zixibacteria bacterium]
MSSFARDFHPARNGQLSNATRLYHKTGDLYLVQRALGHRQITTTEIWARGSDETLKRAVAKA